MITAHQARVIEKLKAKSQDITYYYQSCFGGTMVIARMNGQINGVTPTADIHISSKGEAKARVLNLLDTLIAANQARPLADLEEVMVPPIAGCQVPSTDGIYTAKASLVSQYLKKGKQWYRANGKGGWIKLTANARHPDMNYYCVAQKYEDGRLTLVGRE